MREDQYQLGTVGRTRRESKSLGAARHCRIVDRLDIGPVFGKQDVADMFRLHRIADQERDDMGTRRHNRELGLGKRSEEHTYELQSLMRISYAVFCLNKKKRTRTPTPSRT